MVEMNVLHIFNRIYKFLKEDAECEIFRRYGYTQTREVILEFHTNTIVLKEDNERVFIKPDKETFLTVFTVINYLLPNYNKFIYTRANPFEMYLKTKFKDLEELEYFLEKLRYVIKYPYSLPFRIT